MSKSGGGDGAPAAGMPDLDELARLGFTQPPEGKCKIGFKKLRRVHLVFEIRTRLGWCIIRTLPTFVGSPIWWLDANLIGGQKDRLLEADPKVFRDEFEQVAFGFTARGLTFEVSFIRVRSDRHRRVGVIVERAFPLAVATWAAIQTCARKIFDGRVDRVGGL